VLTALTLALLVGGPVLFMTRRKVRALLWLEALTLLLLTSADLALVLTCFGLVLLPVHQLAIREKGAPQRPLLARVFKVYHLFGLACFAAAAGLLVFYTGLERLLAMRVDRLDVHALPDSVRPVVFWLFVIAALVRMGVVPFHSWLPVSLERGSLLCVAFLVSMRTGLYLLARVVIPGFPEAAHAAMAALVGLSLFSACYGALAAFGQHDLRRMVGFLIVSQSGIMLTGLVFGDSHAVSGTLLYWVGFAVATTGLVLMVASLSARTGVSDMREFGGLVARVPRLSACFFLFGLATIAIPGSVAFVAEDMLLHGALEAHPLLTLVMILAMVLNAITVVRAFARTFLGASEPRRELGTLEDLLPRERLTAVVLLLTLVAAGLFPQPLIAMQEQAAARIAFFERQPRERASP
jgi:NADH-quinone oxidoreductase subunit M